MPSDNPYVSPEALGHGNHVRRFPILATITCLLGLSVCFIGWTGINQLGEFATPDFNGTIDELPIVKPVWEFFAPSTGTVVVSQVAPNVQLTFVVFGIFGAIMLLAGLTMLYRRLFQRQL